MTERLRSWLARAANDNVFGWCSQGLTCGISVSDGDQTLTLTLGDRPRVHEGGGGGITLNAATTVWDQVLSPTPPPGYHSFGALLRNPAGPEISGDTLTLAQALAALERLVELARPSEAAFAGFAFAHDPETVSGHRRVLTDGNGATACLHWLEAGKGAPIVFLHTAGADARQYLHQLADLALQKNHSLLAFDMPWHGLSSGENDQETTAGYELTEERYLGWVAAFIEQVAGAPALLVGCSMGASMTLTMAARRPDLLRGAIALEAPLRSPGRKSDLLTDARVSNGFHNPAYVRAMLGPSCPQRQRDEACAIYAQARPGVYKGDLHYYSEEYDGEALASAIKDNRVRIELLTGSYDYSASPDNTRAIAALLDPAQVHFTEMDGLGHFPMIEDPDRFRPHFIMALDRLEAR